MEEHLCAIPCLFPEGRWSLGKWSTFVQLASLALLLLTKTEDDNLYDNEKFPGRETL